MTVRNVSILLNLSYSVWGFMLLERIKTVAMTGTLGSSPSTMKSKNYWPRLPRFLSFTSFVWASKKNDKTLYAEQIKEAFRDVYEYFANRSKAPLDVGALNADHWILKLGISGTSPFCAETKNVLIIASVVCCETVIVDSFRV